MKKYLLFTIFLIGGGAAFAQQQQGDFQLQAQGSYMSNSFAGQSFSSGSLYLNASRFLTDNVELGIAPFFLFSTNTTVNLTFFGNYSFVTENAKMVPYAGAQLVLFNLGSDPDFSQTGFGLKAGLRYFITEKVNIDVGPNLTFLGAPANATEGSTMFQFTAGLGYLFGNN